MTPCSIASIVKLEQTNPAWVESVRIKSNKVKQKFIIATEGKRLQVCLITEHCVGNK